MSWKVKILMPVILLSVGLVAKFVMWDFAVSTGKRSGNLVKLSDRGKVLKTWEGTLDLGSGDKLTFDFSIKNDNMAKEMLEHTGEYISIVYEEHMVGWPRDTKYVVVGWTPAGTAIKTSGIKTAPQKDNALEMLNKSLFCSVLGSIYQDQELYKKVKTHLKENNLYLYRQIEKCND